jgi:hypothetical protein
VKALHQENGVKKIGSLRREDPIPQAMLNMKPVSSQQVYSNACQLRHPEQNTR